MTYRGHVENGVVILEDDVRIPDGTIVSIEPIDEKIEDEFKSLREGLLRFSGIIDDLPPDYSVNFRRYQRGELP